MIDQPTKDRILDAAQIVDVVSDFVTLRKRGVNYVGLCPFLDLDAVFLGKVFQCLRIGHLFVLHNEVHYIAALAAGKAFAQSLGWRYVERRGLIVVERAQTYIVHSAFPQRDEV